VELDSRLRVKADRDLAAFALACSLLKSHDYCVNKSEIVMLRHVIALVAVLNSLLFVALANGSEEEFVPWKSVRIDCVKRDPISTVVVKVRMNESKFGAFELTAFGRKKKLLADDLAKLKGFPLSSLLITHEAGYESLGGHTLSCKLKRVFYDDDEDLIQEQVYIMMVKNKPDEVTVMKRRETIKKAPDTRGN